MASSDRPLEALAPLVGTWTMRALFEGAPEDDDGATVTFEFMPSGERFLVERWEIPLPPDAPQEIPRNGISIIGPDPDQEGAYLQHYFDSRGVARVYEMTFRDGAWELTRDTADFSALEFSQRFRGTLSADGNTISGAWEICHDGKTWEHDFNLIYTRTS